MHWHEKFIYLPTAHVQLDEMERFCSDNFHRLSLNDYLHQNEAFSDACEIGKNISLILLFNM